VAVPPGDEYDRRLGAKSFGGDGGSSSGDDDDEDEEGEEGEDSEGDPLDIDSDDLVAGVEYAGVLGWGLGGGVGVRCGESVVWEGNILRVAVCDWMVVLGQGLWLEGLTAGVVEYAGALCFEFPRFLVIVSYGEECVEQGRACGDVDVQSCVVTDSFLVE
jgi:hypothetical protein